MEIEGKRVLVTGANRGLGRALVLACGHAGAREIVAGARRSEEMEPFAPNGGTGAARISSVRLDVTQDLDVQAAAGLGRVDILINNAGIAIQGGALKAEMSDIRREMEVNYFGALRMVRAFAPAMKEHGDGLIVNIASILGKVSIPILGTYCATKAAMFSLGQSLRGELNERGVRVITVFPGTIDTDMSRDFAGPKLTANAAALEILEAIRLETIEAPIGDAAREVLAGLKLDPLKIEKAFAEHRA